VVVIGVDVLLSVDPVSDVLGVVVDVTDDAVADVVECRYCFRSFICGCFNGA